MHRRTLHRIAVIAGVFALLAAAPAASEVSVWSSYEVVASADGIRVDLVVPGGPLSDHVFDGGAPRAQARIDGLGTSSAYAAGVYPDDLTLTVPGLASGITGLPIPAYPLIAASSYPTRPSDEIDLAAAALRAESSDHTSSATARTRTDIAGRLVTRAAVEHGDDGLVAWAEATTEAIAIGPLTIARVHTHAHSTRRAGGDIERASELVVSGARIGGQDVDLTADTSALAALAPHGLAVRYVEPEETDTGIIGAGLEIVVTAPVGLTAGDSVVTLSFGRAVAIVDAVPAPLRGGTVTVPFSPITRADVAPSVEVAPGVVPRPSDAHGGEPADVLAEPPAPAAPGEMTLVVEAWSTTFYLVLVFSAAMAAGVAGAWRRWGVRGLWDS